MKPDSIKHGLIYFALLAFCVFAWSLFLLCAGVVHCQTRFEIPATRDSITVSWQHDTPALCRYNIYTDGAHFLSIPILRKRIARTDLRDSTGLWITAYWINSGIESDPSEKVTVIFKPVVPPPVQGTQVPYYADTAELWKWDKTGAMVLTNRGLQTWGISVPQGQSISKYLVFPKTTFYTLTFHATNGSVLLQIGDQKDRANFPLAPSWSEYKWTVEVSAGVKKVSIYFLDDVLCDSLNIEEVGTIEKPNVPTTVNVE